MKCLPAVNWIKCFAALTVATFTTLLSATAYAQLPTVEEALEISKQTGRPIFALAGQET
ncbi:MAG: hypothetical protein ACI9G1_005867 [Pirellulaceae bacterium]|jgi:hypothetical protein